MRIRRRAGYLPDVFPDPMPLSTLAARLVLAVALVAAASTPTLAQRGGTGAGTPLRPVTRTTALVGARVVVAPGRVLDRATVVVRDGRIEAVGRDVRVPADADVLPADSFTVYAGFVDALGVAGVPKAPDAERYTGNRGDPPRDRAGILPERDVRDLFDPTDARVAALRETGFGAAHIAPRTGLFSGTGAAVLLRATGRGEAARDLVLTGPLSLVARLTPADGVYPSTVMGVAAVVREAFENTRRRTARGTARGAARGPRDGYDAVMDALAPVVAGERRLVLVASTGVEAFRALGLARDIGVVPVLAGLADAAPLADRLRERRVAVFAPLALPDTVAADSLSRTVVLPPSTGVAARANRRVRSAGDVAGERAALTAERREAVRRAEASPAALARAGVPFAFATFDVDAKKVLPNLRRMVAAGLAPDAALAALTTEPARLLGLSESLGTVEPGRIANLVLVRGDLFADSAAVRYVFVEGVRTDVRAARSRRGAAADTTGGPAVAVGSWSITVTTPGEAQRGTFVITGAPGALAGSLSLDGDTFPLETVVLDGADLSFAFTAPDYGRVEVTGSIAGNTFSGTAAVGALGTFPVTATRSPE